MVRAHLDKMSSLYIYIIRYRFTTIPMYKIKDQCEGVAKTHTPSICRLWAHPFAHPAIAWQTSRIFGTGEARNFKFGIRIEPGKSQE